MKAGIDRWSFVALLSHLSLSSAAAETATGTSTAAATTHTVQVGISGNFQYEPNETTANPGDTVLFQFYPTNHSVIRAEYAGWEGCGAAGCNPCVPYELYHPGEEGFFSQNFLVDTFDTTDEWSLLINDTEPIFFYCDAIDSCHPNGMVGVINPNKSVSLTKQYNAAVGANYQLGPGQSWPAEGGTPSSAATTAASSSHGHGHGLSGGAIAGIAIGVAVVVIGLAGALFFFIGRNRAYSSLFKANKPDPITEEPRSETAVGSHPGSDTPGGWTPAMGPGGWTSSEKHNSHDPRFSNLSGYTGAHGSLPPPPHSPGPDEGRFVGYNRMTGAPEFAAEAPMDSTVQEMAVPGGALNAAPVELESNEIQHQEDVKDKK